MYATGSEGVAGGTQRLKRITRMEDGSEGRRCVPRGYTGPKESKESRHTKGAQVPKVHRGLDKGQRVHKPQEPRGESDTSMETVWTRV